MIIDFHALNQKTIGDAYSLSNITKILNQLESAKYFSVFDLAPSFHQI
jgi:vacuolar-type H+-ATPase subunit C/Vma6